MTEMVQFEMLSQLAQVDTAIGKLGQVSSLLQGAHLVGRSVTFSTPGGGTGQGTVSSVLQQGQATYLKVGGVKVPLSSVTSVT